MTAVELITFIIAIGLGGLVRGYSGFGFSAVLVAILGLSFAPTEIVPIAVSMEVLASLGQARSVWSHIDWRRLAVILGAGVVGIPLGVWILLTLPGDLLMLSVYAFILTASVILLAAPRLKSPLTLPTLALAGFVAGIVNGATALSGLVLSLVFVFAGTPPAVMRGTLVAYFFATDLWTGVVLAMGGGYDASVLWRMALGLPILAIGLWLGSRHFGSATPESFRNATLLLLAATAIVGFLRLHLI